MAEEVRYMQM
jgi:hypothetical protein